MRNWEKRRKKEKEKRERMRKIKIKKEKPERKWKWEKKEKGKQKTKAGKKIKGKKKENKIKEEGKGKKENVDGKRNKKHCRRGRDSPAAPAEGGTLPAIPRQRVVAAARARLLPLNPHAGPGTEPPSSSWEKTSEMHQNPKLWGGSAFALKRKPPNRRFPPALEQPVVQLGASGAPICILVTRPATLRCSESVGNQPGTTPLLQNLRKNPGSSSHPRCRQRTRATPSA